MVIKRIFSRKQTIDPINSNRAVTKIIYCDAILENYLFPGYNTITKLFYK